MATSGVSYDDRVVRESTFTQWKLFSPNAEEMARAGFIFKGPADRVECYACGITLDDWKEDQLPMLRHMQAAEYCPVIEAHSRQNDDDISEASSQTTITLSHSSRDSGYQDGNAARLERMQPHLSPVDGSGGTAITLRDNPIPRRRRDRSPAPAQYKQLDERIRSFQSTYWSPALEATPDKLAKAGFYFVGPDDRVKCAYCGGKLKRWREKDVAVEEHVKHFPDCSFVKNIEEQTAVLARNIRSKKKTDNCVSSEELKKEYDAQREETMFSKPAELVRKTIKAMGYNSSHIHRAQRLLREKSEPMDLQNTMTAIQQLEKDIFFGVVVEHAEGMEEADDGVHSDMEDEELSPVTVSVDEVVNKLQQELRAVKIDRDELTHQITCKVCLSSKVDTLFLTCRHFVTCKDCADRVRDCPLCRQVILGTVDVFMA